MIGAEHGRHKKKKTKSENKETLKWKKKNTRKYSAALIFGRNRDTVLLHWVSKRCRSRIPSIAVWRSLTTVGGSHCARNVKFDAAVL